MLLITKFWPSTQNARGLAHICFIIPLQKIGFKIREAQLQKIPYMLVIGDKEVETENVSIRCRKRGDIGTMSVSDFCDMVEKEIREKTIITD